MDRINKRERKINCALEVEREKEREAVEGRRKDGITK